MTSFVQIFLLPTKYSYFPPITCHYCQVKMAAWKFTRKCLMLTLKQLRQRKIVEILNTVKKLSTEMKKWQTSKIIQEISNSNLETGRYGPKSGLAQIIQESWQHCISLRPHGWHLSLVSTKVFLAGPKLVMHLTLPCIFLITFVVSGGRKVRPDKMKLYKKSFILSLCAPLNFSTWPMEWFWLLYSYHRPTRHSPQQ